MAHKRKAARQSLGPRATAKTSATSSTKTDLARSNRRTTAATALARKKKTIRTPVSVGRKKKGKGMTDRERVAKYRSKGGDAGKLIRKMRRSY